MKYFLFLTSVLFFSTLPGPAQRKPATPGLNSIRMAYDQGKYQQALHALEAAEKNNKNPAPDLLYLKVLIQKALLPALEDPAFYNHMDQFEKLEVLRDNCKKYLDLNLSVSTARSLKQKKVQQIQQSLSKYPVAKVQFDEIMHLRNSRFK